MNPLATGVSRGILAERAFVPARGTGYLDPMRPRPTLSPTELELLSWLHGPARAAPDLTTLCAELLQALLDAGVPVDRLNLGVFLLHPELAGVAHQVSRDSGAVTAVEVTHAALRSPAYLESPIRASVEDGAVRRHPLLPGKLQPFPVLTELQENGFTDYLLVPMVGTLGRVHVVSIATQAPGGFLDSVAEAVISFCAPLGLLVDSLTTLALSEVLLSLYVGKQTGPRVLQGEVRLGRGQSIHAAVLYSDMRGFSKMCSSQGTAATIDVLNHYFEVVSRSIDEEGGEVLKLMGDAILAVFPVAEPGSAAEAAAASACFRAAVRAHRELSASPTGHSPLRAGFGLTLGEVVYGNIGAPGRLDFTIIGDAVNLAARLEQLSKTLGRDVLMGPRLAHCANATAHPLGRQKVRGFPEPMALYALSTPLDPPAAAQSL